MNTTDEQYTLKRYGAMLVIFIKGQPIQKFRLENDVCTIGSAQAATKPDIPVDSPLLDDLQGRFFREDNGYHYLNLGTKSTTLYNGDSLRLSEDSDEDGIPLLDDDVMHITNSDNSIVLIYHNHYIEDPDWRTVDLTNGKPKLYISHHEEMTNTEQDEQEVLEDLAELPRRYATLLKENDAWYVEDHSTKFGVYVNNQKVTAKQQLHMMDVVSIGNSLFIYQGDTLCYNHTLSAKNCLVVHIEERSVWNLFKKHALLKDINVTIRPNEMVLILGGSGAGKTTFINAVMGYEKARGKIMKGDIDVYENYNQMKYEIGFVPQQDLLRLEDSVYDTLKNAAQMKMPKATTEEEREKRIQDVLLMFGLDREEKSLVSKLSGGQRKRLSIAVEFIANPTLFFLDEPDSGLDGVMARSLMENLRSITDEGKIVLVITHSPDRVIDLFDKVLVLAKSSTDDVGRLAFYGSPREANNFFGTKSMEDIVRKINRKDEGGEGLADSFIEKYKELEDEK